MNKYYYLLVFMLFTVFLSCGKDNDKYAARVGNYVVKIQDVKTALNSRRSHGDASFENVMKQVNFLVDEKLKLVAAYRAGLDSDSTVQEKVQTFKDRQVYGYMIQKDVIDKIITPDMMKEKYKEQSREWHIRHIFIPLKNKQAPKRKEIIEELTKLRSRAMRGESFDALARQFSKDSLSAGKGGDLGFIKWGDKKFGDSFYTAISKLTMGQVSKIIESDVGFHLVKLEKTRAVHQPPFDEAKNQLQRSFFRTKGKDLDSTFYAYVDRLKKKYNAEYLQENIDSLLIIITEKSKQNIIPRRDPVVLLNSLSPEQRNMPLVTFKGGTFTVERMFKIYAAIQPRRRPAFAEKKALQQFIDRNVPRLLIIKNGYKKGVDKKRTVRNAVKKEEQKILQQRAQQMFVDDSVNITDEQAMQYYQEYSYKYENDAKVEVQEIQTKDIETAKSVAEKAKQGGDFSELAAVYNTDAKMKNSAGKLGLIGAREHGIVGRTAVKMRAGEISGPIKSGDHYSVIKVLRRIPGEPIPFEKSKGRIMRELKSQKRSNLQKAWLQGVRESVPVNIYENVLKQEFATTE